MDTIPFIGTGQPIFLEDQTYPESPCSVNAFIELPSVGRTQITGRGFTGDEAALHFRETLHAMRTAFEPAPAPKRETLGEVATRWLARAAQNHDYALVERIAKAVALVVAGCVRRTMEDDDVITDAAPVDAYHVQSLDAEKCYRVGASGNIADIVSCTCKDFSYRSNEQQGFLCKHGLAALLYRGTHHE